MSKAERTFSVIFGLFLVGVGIYALLFGQTPAPWRIGGGMVLALFGGNMLYAAYRCKPSWLSRIGPLP
jgi:small neutral amino acid transporter SnatA (MarC family)